MFSDLLLFFEVNWSNISTNWADFIMSGYDDVFGHWVYPLILLGIVGYVYCINRSALSAAAGICIIFSVFGATAVFRYPDIPEFSLIGVLIAVGSFAGLFAVLFTMRQRSVR